MKEHIEKRTVEIAEYILKTEATVRQAANIFQVSKSTVHKDLSERLERINPDLAKKVRQIFDQNKAEMHIRGGNATRLKYKSKTN